MPASAAKPQRVRDPLHDLIEFGTGEFEQMLWRLIQTPEFQRLSRVRQLGFSEYVYPGATHTRFIHSIGVFHNARRLMRIVRRQVGDRFDESRSQVALAAALLHDIGHGPFSHAFEAFGKDLKLNYAKHEFVSYEIIQKTEIADILNNYKNGMSDQVADIFGASGQTDIYKSVVSSQCDGDRLDYMQRDRMMTGARQGAIDYTWLMENLEVDKLNEAADDYEFGNLETLVFGEKAIYAVEAYIVALYQLYPTIYFHKTTRAVEMVYFNLLKRLFNLVNKNDLSATGLPNSHPIISFCKRPESLENALRLDDTVILGALPELCNSSDAKIAELAKMLKDRKLPKATDIREIAAEGLGKNVDVEVLNNAVNSSLLALEEMNRDQRFGDYGIWVDSGERVPYKDFVESSGPLNQIRIRESGSLRDLKEVSSIVAAIPPFKFNRVYVPCEEQGLETLVHETIKQKSQEARRS